MDTKVCEYILEIARQKSITKAAETLEISQSALSQCLIRVEKEMGASLFNRRKTSLTPTDAGKLYIEAAESVVDIKRRLKTELSSLTGKKCICLGVSSIWGMDMLMEIIPVFRERFPEVTLELDNGNFAALSDGYVHGKYDMLITCASDGSKLPGEYYLLRKEELKLIISANHPFANRHWNRQVLPREIISQELQNVDVIRHERGATNHEVENELFKNLGINARTICRLGNYAALLHLVGGGMGYAVVSGDVVDRDERVKSWSLNPKVERSNYIIIHPNVNMGSPEKYLIELIKSYRLFNKQ